MYQVNQLNSENSFNLCIYDLNSEEIIYLQYLLYLNEYLYLIEKTSEQLTQYQHISNYLMEIKRIVDSILLMAEIIFAQNCSNLVICLYNLVKLTGIAKSQIS